MVIRNESGFRDLSNVSLTLECDPRATFQRAEPAPNPDSPTRWDLGTLEVSQWKAVKIYLKVDLIEGTLVNKVYVTSPEFSGAVSSTEETDIAIFTSKYDKWKHLR